MATSSRVVKITAKTTLKNNFLRSVFSSMPILFCIFIGIYISSFLDYIGGSIVSGIFLTLFTVFLTVPLCLGVIRFFWRMLFSVNDNPISVFYYFSNKGLYLKTLKLTGVILFKAIVPALILAIPVVGLWLVSKGAIFEMIDMSIPLWTANLSYIYVFVKTLAIILLILHMFKYYMAPLFIIADKNMDIDEAIHMSTMIAKKSSIDFSYLIFSFIGWIILSFLVIPLVFTLPYFLTSYAVHFRFAVAEYNKHVEESIADEFPTFVAGTF